MEEERNITTVEFKTELDRGLPVIAGEIKFIEQQVTMTVMEGAIAIGRRLLEAKALVGHGNFENWCSENLSYSKSKAERFMKISTEYGDKNSPFSNPSISTDLSIYKALSLLQVPKDEVETFVEEHDISDMTVKELEAEIRKLKAEKEEAIEEAGSLEEERLELKNRIVKADAELESLKEQLAEANSISDPARITEYEEMIEILKQSIEEARAKENHLNDMLNKKDKKIKNIASREHQKAFKEAEEIYSEKMEAAAKKNEEELRTLTSQNEELKLRAESLERKLNNTADEGKMKFKILVDQLQDSFEACKKIANEEDADTGKKMKQALFHVLESMLQTV